MVHALTQAYRVLTPGGLLLDLRPDHDPAGRRRKQLPVHVVTADAEYDAGAVIETSSYYQDFAAADRSVQRVIRQGLFELEGAEIFHMRWYFRTIETLQNTLAGDWTGTQMPPATRRRLMSLLETHPCGEIAVKETFRLNALRKK